MSTTDLPGSSLLAGRYRLVERLGAGGMSVVWRGFDEVLGRQVAVKVLPPSTSTDRSFRRRLRAEAQAAARLSHPNITNVYDYGEATTVDGEPVPYVVMELVDGESLAAVLARVRRLPWPTAVRICSEVAAALAAAHARGIVHRDVTPANVMLTASGAFRGRPPSASAPRSRPHSPRRTPAASCTATSPRPTSCSRRPARR